MFEDINGRSTSGSVKAAYSGAMDERGRVENSALVALLQSRPQGLSWPDRRAQHQARFGLTLVISCGGSENSGRAMDRETLHPAR